MPAPKRKPGTSLTPISDKECVFAHLLIKGDRTDAECAEQAGFARTDARKLRLKPRIQEYIRLYREQFAFMLASRELDAAAAIGIDRNALVQRLWMLANTVPERTRGSIDGQVAAVDKIADMLGYKIQPRNLDDFFKGKSDEQVANYLAYGSFDVPAPN